MAKTPSMISDAAVAAKTGKTWKEWFAILDEAGAKKMSHKQIVARLSERHAVGPWWQQMIAVTYEQQRGLRKLHEKPEGFQISASKTIGVPASMLYAAWTDARMRRRWLGSAPFKITTATSDKSLRIRWGENAERLDVSFYAKGDSKTQVTIQHGRLPDSRKAGQMKRFWKEQLEALQALLEKR